jgi:hypothetical protein
MLNRCLTLACEIASSGRTVRFLRVMIGVFWKRKSRPIELHQCSLLTHQFFFCLNVYRPWPKPRSLEQYLYFAPWTFSGVARSYRAHTQPEVRRTRQRHGTEDSCWSMCWNSRKQIRRRECSCYFLLSFCRAANDAWKVKKVREKQNIFRVF